MEKSLNVPTKLNTLKVTLIHHLVLSHLDYSNLVLSGLPDSSTNILQKVQNSAARLVLGRSANNSSTENTKQLHWLPVKQCINYKVLTLVCKCQHQKAPKYLPRLAQWKISKKARSTIRKVNMTTGSTIHKKKNKKKQTKTLPVKDSMYMHQLNNNRLPVLWNLLHIYWGYSGKVKKNHMKVKYNLRQVVIHYTES